MHASTPRPVMLITGASRGIGRAVALQAASAGYNLCLSYHSNREAAETLLQAVSERGAEAILARADIGTEADILSMFNALDARFGTLQCLVNNAGILGVSTKLVNFDRQRIERTMQVNVTGTILCAREAVRRMSTLSGGTGGTIINVSSRAACLGSPNEYIDYAASKGAIDSLTIGLSREVGAEGIRVNAVRPGLIKTDIHESSGDPGRVERLVAGVPMSRSGEPEEVANSILWLASEQSEYVTGSFIEVSGGR